MPLFKQVVNNSNARRERQYCFQQYAVGSLRMSIHTEGCRTPQFQQEEDEISQKAVATRIAE